MLILYNILIYMTSVCVMRVWQYWIWKSIWYQLQSHRQRNYAIEILLVFTTVTILIPSVFYFTIHTPNSRYHHLSGIRNWIIHYFAKKFQNKFPGKVSLIILNKIIPWTWIGTLKTVGFPQTIDYFIHFFKSCNFFAKF